VSSYRSAEIGSSGSSTWRELFSKLPRYLQTTTPAKPVDELARYRTTLRGCDAHIWTRYTDPGTLGSYQQYVVSPARYTSPIPDGVDDFIAGPIMCSASTVYRSLVESRLQPGEWAVFPGGGGGVGIQGVQLAKAMGLRPIVIDTGAEKKELCMKMGAEAFVDFKESKDVAAEVVKIADGVGAHGVIVTAPSAYNGAIGLVGDRVGAKVMCIGLRMLSPNYLLRP